MSSLSFPPVKESLQALNIHSSLSRALPQFRSSIFVFGDVAEISGAALHERSRSKIRDKACQSPRRRPWAKFNARPSSARATPDLFLLVITNESFSAHQISMVLLAFFLPRYFISLSPSPFSLSLSLHFHPIFETITLARIQRDETFLPPFVRDIGVPDILSTYVGYTAYILPWYAAPQARSADTHKAKLNSESSGYQILLCILLLASSRKRQRKC